MGHFVGDMEIGDGNLDPFNRSLPDSVGHWISAEKTRDMALCLAQSTYDHICIFELAHSCRFTPTEMNVVNIGKPNGKPSPIEVYGMDY